MTASLLNTVRPEPVEGHLVSRSDIVRTARSWLGTPYQHQARCKGAGVDCVGLLVGVAAELGVSDFDYTTYGRMPSANQLLAVMQAQARPVASDAPLIAGQICLMRFSSEPQHTGILAQAADGGINLIHAYSNAGAVVEHRLADVWRARIVARFDFPSIAN